MENHIEVFGVPASGEVACGDGRRCLCVCVCVVMCFGVWKDWGVETKWEIIAEVPM